MRPSRRRRRLANRKRTEARRPTPATIRQPPSFSRPLRISRQAAAAAVACRRQAQLVLRQVL